MTEPKRIPYVDLAGMGMAEDDRIETIGRTAIDNPGRDIVFIVDDDGEKAKRYILKLKRLYPSIAVIGQGKVGASSRQFPPGAYIVRIRATPTEAN